MAGFHTEINLFLFIRHSQNVFSWCGGGLVKVEMRDEGVGEANISHSHLHDSLCSDSVQLVRIAPSGLNLAVVIPTSQDSSF